MLEIPQRTTNKKYEHLENAKIPIDQIKNSQFWDSYWPNVKGCKGLSSFYGQCHKSRIQKLLKFSVLAIEMLNWTFIDNLAF